jgi:small subunit ribosomal protein S17
MSESPENTEQEAAVESDAASAPLSGADAPAGDGTTRADSSPAPTPSSPAENLPPKERRQRARAEKAAKRPVASARSDEERHAERLAVRASKAGERRTQRERARAKAKSAHAGEPTAAPTQAREHAEGRQKTRQGIVVSDKADKTITVRIDTARRHRRYEKIVRTSRTLHAHDETNDAHLGDTVIVREARPLSRTKRWRLVQVLERAK